MVVVVVVVAAAAADDDDDDDCRHMPNTRSSLQLAVDLEYFFHTLSCMLQPNSTLIAASCTDFGNNERYLRQR